MIEYKSGHRDASYWQVVDELPVARDRPVGDP